MKMKVMFFTLMIMFGSIQSSQAAEFKAGPLIAEYGKHTAVKQDLVLNKQMKFKVAFDVSEQGDKAKVNGKFNTLARFLNMHVANGISPGNIELALVIHGKAGFDLMNNKAFQAKYSTDNPNHELLALLMKNKVKIYLCGQSAAYFKIDNSDLQTGVKMALSAMTANAILQQQGYTLNPF